MIPMAVLAVAVVAACSPPPVIVYQVAVILSPWEPVVLEVEESAMAPMVLTAASVDQVSLPSRPWVVVEAVPAPLVATVGQVVAAVMAVLAELPLLDRAMTVVMVLCGPVVVAVAREVPAVLLDHSHLVAQVVLRLHQASVERVSTTPAAVVVEHIAAAVDPEDWAVAPRPQLRKAEPEMVPKEPKVATELPILAVVLAVVLMATVAELVVLAL